MNVTRIFTNAAHLELACRVHRILVAVGKGELAIPEVTGKRSTGLSTKRSSSRSFSVTTSTRKRRREQAAPTPRRGDPPQAVRGLSETMDNGNDACRRNSGAGGAEMPNGECDKDAEARSIAAELVRLHKAGAIKNEPDASFYAKLVKRFGAPALETKLRNGEQQQKHE